VRRVSFVLATVVLLCMCVGPGFGAATVLFSDDFDSETGGLRSTPSKWEVSGGSVDIIPVGADFDYLPGNGKYVDLDGSTNHPGVLTTKLSFDLTAGSTYLLEYRLAGSQRDDVSGASETETVVVSLEGTALTRTHEVPHKQAFESYAWSFTVPGDVLVRLSFENTEASPSDNMGPLLDTVRLSVVPVPGGVLLAGLGAGLLGWLRRRKVL